MCSLLSQSSCVRERTFWLIQGPCRHQRLRVERQYRFVNEIAIGLGHGLTAKTSVVRLDIDIGDLSILDYQGISLAPVGSQDGCSVELNIESAGEAAIRVTEKADATALVCIEGFAPGVHAVEIKEC